jgi:hypothetical protein
MGRAIRSSRRRIKPAPNAPATPSSESGKAGTGQWFPDPTGRGDRRYWDGRSWTNQVSRRGTNTTDSISGGYARPEQFRFHEDNAVQTKVLETAEGTVWRDAFGGLHRQR